jgi:hypothetical protein
MKGVRNLMRCFFLALIVLLFSFVPITILRTKLARDRAVRAKFVEIRVRFNQGKV